MKKIVSYILGIALIMSVVSCKSEYKKTLDGKVKRESISIAPKLAGRIVKIYVHESQTVKEGDTLAYIDIPEIEAKSQQAHGALLAAGSQYEMAVNGATSEQKDQVEAMYKSAKEQYELAEKSLKRVRNMYADSLISGQVFDETLTKYNMAKAQLDAAVAKRKEVNNGIRNEQVNMALGQKKQAEGAVHETEIASRERYIIAPKDMTIETIALHEGELALPGYNIFVGVAPTSTWFRFTAPESQISKFKKDSVYTILFPFEKGKSIQANLTCIVELSKYANKTSSYPNYQMGEAMYELKFVPVDTQLANSLMNNYSLQLQF